jgi:hypothetical protein
MDVTLTKTSTGLDIICKQCGETILRNVPDERTARTRASEILDHEKNHAAPLSPSE